MEIGMLAVGGLLLVGGGFYVLVGFASRRYFQEKERHLKRIVNMDLTEENHK